VTRRRGGATAFDDQETSESAHLRQTTATHLLRTGVDINTIRAWLGHVGLSTTSIYAEVDLQMKAKALATCEVTDGDPQKTKQRCRDDKELMGFLKTL
jgi:integrase/recombinase XerD